MSVEYVAQEQSYLYCNLSCTFNVVFTVKCAANLSRCIVSIMFHKKYKKTDAFDSLATANSVVTFIETFMVQWETNSSCFVIFCLVVVFIHKIYSTW